ncbi:hypothetical protein D3C72_1676210 [compost metagenome]
MVSPIFFSKLAFIFLLIAIFIPNFSTKSSIISSTISPLPMMTAFFTFSPIFIELRIDMPPKEWPIANSKGPKFFSNSKILAINSVILLVFPGDFP